MSFSHSSLSAQVKSYLTFLPEEIRQKILEHLHSVIHYEPVIGIMGTVSDGRATRARSLKCFHLYRIRGSHGYFRSGTDD